MSIPRGSAEQVVDKFISWLGGFSIDTYIAIVSCGIIFAILSVPFILISLVVSCLL